jgi:hypothetical protein
MERADRDVGRADRDVGKVPRSRQPESAERAAPSEPQPESEAGSAEPAEPSGSVEQSTVDGAELGERQRAILDFERQWWKHAGAKEQAIRDAFQISPTRYYQLLNALLDDPAALAYDPVTVQRLRRLRSARVRARGTRR